MDTKLLDNYITTEEVIKVFKNSRQPGGMMSDNIETTLMDISGFLI